MKTLPLYLTILSLGAMALAGCSSEKKTTIAGEDGESITVSSNDDGDGVSYEYKDNTTGEKVRSTMKIEGDLPEGLKAYPGAKVINYTTTSTNGNLGAVLMQQTGDSMEKVESYYRKHFEQSGFAIEHELTIDKARMLAAKNKSGRQVSVNLSPEESGTGTVINLTSVK